WRELKFLYGRDLTGFPNQKTADTLRIIAPNGQTGRSGANVPRGTLYFSHFCPRMEMDVRFVTPSPVAPWVACKASEAKISRVDPEFMPREDIPAPLTLTDEQKAVFKIIAERFWKGRPPKTKPVSTKELQDIVSSLTTGMPKLPPLDADKQLALRDALKEAGAWDALMGRLSFEPASGFVSRAFPPSTEPDSRPYRTIIDQLYAPATEAESMFTGFGLTGMYLKLILSEEDGREKWRDLMALSRNLDWSAEHGNIQSDGTVTFHLMINEGYGKPILEQLASVVPLLHGTPFEAKKAEAVCKCVIKAMHLFSFSDQEPHFFDGRHRTGIKLGWPFAQNQILQMAKCGTPETGGIDRESASIYLLYAQYYKKNANEFPDIAKFEAMGIKPASPEGHFTLNYAASGIHRRDNWMAVVRGQKKGFKSNEMYGFQACNVMGRFLNYAHLIIHSKGDPINTFESGVFSWMPQWVVQRAIDGKNNKIVDQISHGWNWALWPGTTSRLIPHDALRSRFLVEEMITDEPFAGDTALDGNGIFGMKLDEPLPGKLDPTRIGPAKYWLGDKLYGQYVRDSRYDTGFTARKSYFMFDNRIVCLGSGINSTDDTYPAVTTLFQHPLSSLKDKQMEPAKGEHWMMDSFDNGYYIPAGNNTLQTERKFQKLPFHPYWLPSDPKLHESVDANEGETELAYFNHGVKAANAGYEYAMLIDTTPEKMAGFAKEMAKQSSVVSRQSPADKNQDQRPYEILQKDSNAHILWDRDSKTTGYVIFDASWFPSNTDNRLLITDNLLKVDKPCLVMIKDLGGNKLKISFCNPDLGRQYAITGPANEDEQVATVTLKGRWQLQGSPAEAQVSLNGESTTITFRTRGAKPALVEMDRL
ncbi:MAG: polysaccharide lyase family 8 super-sandwich domain-containing protein, partial [Victivallales bacterium]